MVFLNYSEFQLIDKTNRQQYNTSIFLDCSGHTRIHTHAGSKKYNKMNRKFRNQQCLSACLHDYSCWYNYAFCLELSAHVHLENGCNRTNCLLLSSLLRSNGVNECLEFIWMKKKTKKRVRTEYQNHKSNINILVSK